MNKVEFLESVLKKTEVATKMAMDSAVVPPTMVVGVASAAIIGVLRDGFVLIHDRIEEEVNETKETNALLRILIRKSGRCVL